MKFGFCVFRLSTSFTSFFAAANSILSKSLGLELEDGISKNVFKFWFDKAKCVVAPELEAQKFDVAILMTNGRSHSICCAIDFQFFCVLKAKFRSRPAI